MTEPLTQTRWYTLDATWNPYASNGIFHLPADPNDPNTSLCRPYKYAINEREGLFEASVSEVSRCKMCSKLQKKGVTLKETPPEPVEEVREPIVWRGRTHLYSLGRWACTDNGFGTYVMKDARGYTAWVISLDWPYTHNTTFPTAEEALAASISNYQSNVEYVLAEAGKKLEQLKTLTEAPP